MRVETEKKTAEGKQKNKKDNSGKSTKELKTGGGRTEKID